MYRIASITIANLHLHVWIEVNKDNYIYQFSLMNRFQASVTRLEVTIQVIIPHPAFNQQIIIQLFKCSGFNFSDFKNLFPFLHFDKTTTTTMYLTNTYTRTLSPPIADKLKNPLYQLIPTHTFWQSHYVQHKHTLLDSLSFFQA